MLIGSYHVEVRLERVGDNWKQFDKDTGYVSDTVLKLASSQLYVRTLDSIYTIPYSFKDGLSLKIKIIHIHLYFIATQDLCKYALVEDIDD